MMEQHLATAKRGNELQAVFPARGLWGYLGWAGRLLLIITVSILQHYTHTNTHKHTCINTLRKKVIAVSIQKGENVKFLEGVVMESVVIYCRSTQPHVFTHTQACL